MHHCTCVTAVRLPICCLSEMVIMTSDIQCLAVMSAIGIAYVIRIACPKQLLTCASVLQSLLTGKQPAKDSLAILDQVTKTKSMALLLRTFVAAYVQKELHHSGCRDDGYVLQLSVQISSAHNVSCADSNTG